MLECIGFTINGLEMENKKIKKNKTFFILGIISLSLFALFFFVFAFLGSFLSPQDKLEKADVIIAISGGNTTARTSEAVDLYKEGWSPYLLFSGAASSGDVSNAKSMKNYAIKNGVPENKILIEEEGGSTYQNALYSSKIIEEKGFKSIILVTSPYHQRRAYMNFRHVLGDDVKIINHSADDKNWSSGAWYSSKRNLNTTFDELSRVVYLFFTKNYSLEAK